MLVGVQLAGIREDAGLAQEQAARAIGFSPAKLSRIEAGKGRRPPTEGDVRALLELYKTDEHEVSVCSSRCGGPVSRSGGSATTSG